jgi:hypothetical protein
MGPHFVRLHRFEDKERDVEARMPVRAAELPAGAATATCHFGTDDRLGDRDGAAAAWSG